MPTNLLFNHQYPHSILITAILIVVTNSFTKRKIRINDSQILNKFPEPTSKLPTLLYTNENGDQT